ncbi:metallophosphoesterase [Flavisolibacter sp. BT320]|nr:metallophosphoesterase [Flavisolibacter longurius]
MITEDGLPGAKRPKRKAIFVGDYIDRGPAIRETLQIIKGMTEENHAYALLGNHEYNTLAYHHRMEDGNYLRSHSAKHTTQHAQTLIQFYYYQEEWQEYLQWFYTLPLFMERDGIRAVHACWDENHISWLEQHGCRMVTPELLKEAHVKGTHVHRVMEETLKGKEINIPYTWYDKDGHERSCNRLKWWVCPADQVCYDEIIFDCPEAMAKTIFDEKLGYVYPKDAPPVFFGHYWLKDKSPVLQTGNVACLDYSVAKGGNLVGYRWKGERVLLKESFVFCNS